VDVPAERNAARPQTDSDAQLRGRQLGDFVLRECIGEGAFAAVYRSDQLLLGREAVVKVLHHRLRASEVVLQRFMREARLASRIDHPYAAHVYAFGVEPDDGLAWIAMELVHGTSLERWLRERGPLPLDSLVTFFGHVAEVVQNAHDHGIVHRDLKPSNVMMIEVSGRVFPKLLDFGIAKLVDDAALELPGIEVELSGPLVQTLDDSGNSSQLTQANATLGSPPYMPPEQWTDPLSVGPRSDLYSLAVMAYEALTGHQPFIGPTIAAIGEQHCNADVPRVGDRFPAALDRVFQRALAKRPEDRPASALAFASELRAAAAERPDEPPRLRPASATTRRPNRALWLLAGGAALVAGGLGGRAMLAPGDVAAPAAFSRTVEPMPPPLPALAPAGMPATPAVPAAPIGSPPPASPGTAAVRDNVTVEITSSPRGAAVFRLPSETRVGATPWKAELPSETGVQVFLVRKPGFIDRLIEIDLRTGGTQTVKLVRATRRAPAPPVEPVRRKGEPVDPFSPSRTP
jgi:serine/threonine protein kinase